MIDTNKNRRPEDLEEMADRTIQLMAEIIGNPSLDRELLVEKLIMIKHLSFQVGYKIGKNSND